MDGWNVNIYYFYKGSLFWTWKATRKKRDSKDDCTEFIKCKVSNQLFSSFHFVYKQHLNPNNKSEWILYKVSEFFFAFFRFCSSIEPDISVIIDKIDYQNKG